MSDRVRDSAPFARIAQVLAGVAKEGELIDDPAQLRLFSADIFSEGRPPAAILRPSSIEGLASVITACCAAGIPIVPRGGGLSYSAGYVADRDDVLMIDLRGLNAITAIDVEHGFVTVEAGCTWSRLRDHLRPLGLRTCFWGPSSGDGATIGGAFAQEAVLFGSGRHGLAGDTLLGLTLLVADGRLLEVPGPSGDDPRDFVGDCGALGVKVQMTLPLEQLPAETGYRAFSFETTRAGLDALTATGAATLASECFLFDRFSCDRRRQAAPHERWIEPVPGQRHHSGSMLELHAAFEGPSVSEVYRAARWFEKICRSHAGTPIGEGVLRSFHDTPFGPPFLMLGPGSRRWLPLHFVVPHARLHALNDEIRLCMTHHADVIQHYDLSWGWSAMPIGADQVLLEPSIYWKDAQPEQVTTWFDPATLEGRPTFPSDANARAAVAELRAALIGAGRRVEARHIQIGRLYPPDAALAQWTLSGLAARKKCLDPKGIMNPGVLGLG